MHDDSADDLLTDEVSVYSVSTSSSFPFLSPSLPIRSRFLPHPGDYDVPDLNLVQTSLGVLVYVDVDGEMCVDISHLVLEAFGDTDNQVVDEGSDCAEGSDVLSGTVVQFDVDNILLWVGEVDGQVVEVLRELACNSSIRSPMSSQVFPAFGAYLVDPQQ